MKGKHWLVVFALFAVAASGCRELNREFCLQHPEDVDCAQAPGDECGDTRCMAPTAVCKMGTTCVECVVNTECPESRPTCSADNTCIECEQDSNCESGLCLADRTCAAPDEVAYVDATAGVDNEECSAAMPCKTLPHVLGLVPRRVYIKATGTFSSGVKIVIDRRPLTIIGQPGMTTIERTGGGKEPVLEIKHESVVALVDVEIVGALDGNAVDIKDAPGPVVTMTRVTVRNAKDNGIQLSLGKLVMADSQVSNSTLNGVVAAAGSQVEIRDSSIIMNQGTGVLATDATMVLIDSSIIAVNDGSIGGVSIKGPLSITNSIIAANGNSATSAVGGVFMDSSNARFEFNTVADNEGTAGVSCAKRIDLSNSIFAGSSFSGLNCNVTYSLTTPTDPAIPTGMNNEVGDPMFLSTSLSSPMFYRIGPNSAAKDKADPNATLDIDIDGQERKGLRDMGADEVN